MSSKKKPQEIPVPEAPVPQEGPALPGLTLEEIQMFLGNQAILIMQQAKENRRQQLIILTLQNRIREMEGPKG
jgi:hypothetical protein